MFFRAGVEQPSVEIRFDDLCARKKVPQSSVDGLFTVGKDLKSKMIGVVSTVTRRKPPMAEYSILRNLSGVFYPGRVTLILGPPGGGKSMLMKVRHDTASDSSLAPCFTEVCTKTRSPAEEEALPWCASTHECITVHHGQHAWQCGAHALT